MSAVNLRMGGLRLVWGSFLMAALAGAAMAQFSNPAPTTQVHDASALVPPPGARVAIVEFEDMECPVCGLRNPTLKKAAQDYKIPWIRHDFPLRQHAWSFQSAVNARWFDTKSKKLGDDYRDAIFENQPSFYNNPQLMNDFTQKFAASHGIQMPMAVDPQGKLAADVKADYDLGVRTGVDSTPSVWIVTSHSKGAPYIQVPSSMLTLYTTIDQALRDTKDAFPATATKKKPVAK